MRQLQGHGFDRSAFTSRDALRGYAVTLAAITFLTAALAFPHRHLGLLNIGLLFLMLVVLIAARWGWGPGLVASVMANLAFNFFFVSPRHTFTVQDPANALALAVFLAVAALTSFLLARARAGETEARRRAEETAVLYDLSRLIMLQPDTARTLAAVCERIRQTFEVEACAILVPVDGQLAPAARIGPAPAPPSSAWERGAAEGAFRGGETVFRGGQGRRSRTPRIVGRPPRRAPIAYLPLRVGPQPVGVLEVVGTRRARVFTTDELRLLEAFADIAALTVERERLLREAAGAQALKATNQLKSALLAAVSHDLRTPLAAIKSSVSGLLDASVAWEPATRHELLSAIDEETDRLTRLVANLLDLSRIEGGALRPDIDWYDLGELLETVTARLARATPRHRLVLDIADNAGTVPCDYVQIGQVVTNLVENAAKFAPPGTAISISARRLPDTVEICVIDEGPGIPPGEREAIFEKFYRGQRESHRASGSGLGLAISKGIVEAHGGRIRADAAPGGGARVCFTLPLAAASGQRPSNHSAPEQVPVS